MRKSLQKSIGLFLTVPVLLSGCAAKGPSSDRTMVETEQTKETHTEQTVSGSQVQGIPFTYQVHPEEFDLAFQVENDSIPVSGGMQTRTVADYREDGKVASWRYPDEQISVTLKQEEDYLSVEITSEKQEDHTFTWPHISSDQYFMPLGEGKRVPSDDSAWQEYLDDRQFSLLEQFSMPFWISSEGDYSVLYIMEDPYRTELDFSAQEGISFSVTHEYPEIDANKTNRFRIYLTDDNPVNAAKLYRRYVTESGKFLTLEQKAEENPNIRKLYGAPFIYLWGEHLISDQDINWQAFRKALGSQTMEYVISFADRIENGEEFKTTVGEIRQQDYVADYQKNIICAYISKLMDRDDFWDPDMLKQDDETLDQLLAKGYENLSKSERIQVNKYALSAALPEVFGDASGWMDDSTVQLLEEMKDGGIEHAWIGLNSWEQAYAKPELVKAADQLGYLIASYDSYHSIHEPGKEQWITAKFNDSSLYEDATITNKNGEKESGFQKVGRKLNPTLSMPAVKDRMEQIMSESLPFNSWFIDCDATGEIFDDYTPGHITTQEEDLAARLERMSYIRDQYGLVVGSEGGHDFAADTIAFAHGIELKSFSWMDADMSKNKDSEFYIGKYYNAEGGVAEHFAKRIPVKEQYYAVFADPKYDIPLFKLVYNDSVITGYHWDWSTFKIQGATADRMLREVLYNVPPMYHLDGKEWAKYKNDIINHQAVWSEFSQQAITQEMTDFEYLTGDGTVQKTVYGEKLTAIANFGDSPCRIGEMKIPAHSVWIDADGTQSVYTPSVEEENQ